MADFSYFRVHTVWGRQAVEDSEYVLRGYLCHPLARFVSGTGNVRQHNRVLHLDVPYVPDIPLAPPTWLEKDSPQKKASEKRSSPSGGDKKLIREAHGEGKRQEQRVKGC